MTQLRHRYSAREFNRNPSVVSRAAREFGHVVVTVRGRESLVLMDAEEYRRRQGAAPPMTVFDALVPPVELDDEVLGAPPRMELRLKVPQDLP